MLAELERENYLSEDDQVPELNDPRAIFAVGLFKGLCEAMQRLGGDEKRKPI